MRHYILGSLLFFSALSFAVASTAETKQVEVNFTQLTYIDQGQGIPVVFVHGSIGDWRTFEKLRDSVANEYRFISYSRRYHYPNKWTDEGENYTVSQHVEDLAELIKTLKLGKVHLVGTSYGGRIAGMLAVTHPELVRSLVMTDPFLMDLNSGAGKQAQQDFFADIREVDRLLKSDHNGGASIAFYNASNASDHDYKTTNAFLRQQIYDNMRVLKPMLASALPRPLSCEEVANIHVPVYLISTKFSRKYYQLGNKKLAMCLPTDKLTTENIATSHLLFSEKPQELSQMLLKFLRQH